MSIDFVIEFIISFAAQMSTGMYTTDKTKITLHLITIRTTGSLYNTENYAAPNWTDYR